MDVQVQRLLSQTRRACNVIPESAIVNKRLGFVHIHKVTKECAVAVVVADWGAGGNAIDGAVVVRWPPRPTQRLAAQQTSKRVR